MSRFFKGLIQVIHGTSELLLRCLRLLADNPIPQLNDLLFNSLNLLL